MRAIGQKNTRPEMLLRQLLHRSGFRFRLHVKELPGSPDIVLPKYRAVVFINGCFWHGHDCYLFKLPRSRQEFWIAKISANRARDEKNKVALREKGWRVLTVWECAIKGRLKHHSELLTQEVTAWLCAEKTKDGFEYKEIQCREG